MNPMTALTRRSSLTLIAGGVAALGTKTPDAEAAVKTFVAFGDSYTRTYRAGIPTWADQINASGAAKMLVDLAVSGSFAAGSNAATTLDGQVDRWIGTYKSRGVPDRTVIYMGNNDVGFGGSLTTAMNQYRAQVDRLIANRVTYGSRRLVLCLLHDWSRNPSSTTSVRSRVRWWNDHLASIAAARPNVVTVNLFTRFEDVFAHRTKYGLVNVTAPNKSLSATTYLYFDGYHFGRKGHAIIAKEVVPKLQ
jgi:lysophospholipase L1-like esterase